MQTERFIRYIVDTHLPRGSCRQNLQGDVSDILKKLTENQIIVHIGLNNEKILF